MNSPAENPGQSTQSGTSRSSVEIDLRASDRRLRLALEAAGAIAFVWDVTTDSVTRYFSKEPALPQTSEHVGTIADVRRCIHIEDLDAFNSNLAASLAGGSEYHNVYRVVRPDGTIRNLEEFGYIDRASDGKPMRLTVCR